MCSLPYIKFHVGPTNKTYKGMLSTGNSLNICSKSFANEVTMRLGTTPPTEEISIKIHHGGWMDATPQTTAENIKVPITVFLKNGKKKKLHVDFLVLEMHPQDALLGCDFVFSRPIRSFTADKIIFDNGDILPIHT